MNEKKTAFTPPKTTLDGALGITFDLQADGTATGTMPITDNVRQPYGIVHGGAYASLAETVASAGTFAQVYENNMIALGMSNQTQFLRSASEGTITAVGVPLQQSKTTWVWDVTMSDDDGNVCAVSRMVIAVRPRR